MTGTYVRYPLATGGGANTTLSNLGITSINTDLLPSSNDTRSLGSTSLGWIANVNSLTLLGSISGTLTHQAYTMTTPYTLTWPSTVSPMDGYVLASDHTGNLSWAPLTGGAGVGTVTSVTSAYAPLSVTDTTTTPIILLPKATTSTDGYLTSTDWTTFNSKGGGTVTSVSGSGDSTGLTLTGGPITTSGTLTLGGTLNPASGGTGVANNNASTLTISGNAATTLTVTGPTSVTLPTSGTLAQNTLNNLGTVSFNSDLVPNGNNTRSLGSPAAVLKDGYFNQLDLVGGGTTTLKAGGTYTITFPATAPSNSLNQILVNPANSGVLVWQHGIPVDKVTAATVRSSPVALTSNTPANVTSITLTAGHYAVTAQGGFQYSAATATNQILSMNDTSATLSGTDTIGVYDGGSIGQRAQTNPLLVLTSTDETMTMEAPYVSILGSKTFYLVAQCTFSAGTVNAYGSITAIRLDV